ncbi:hypothetical protein V6N11_058774 [Hibiscus sabdariffa]|uniref:Uncharacterized protein n=1 Tax=Hibiscus sabdariffa TaxID=183260 RepID=A0ABR2U581_9ROSI
MCIVEGKRKGKMGGIRMRVMKGGGDGGERVEKLKSSKTKLWMIRTTTLVLLWTCIVQLTALGNTWGPRLLKDWPSCYSHQDSSVSVVEDKDPSVLAVFFVPKGSIRTMDT